MDVVLNAANDNWLAAQIRQDTAEVSVHFLAERIIFEIRRAFFGREHRVNLDFCKQEMLPRVARGLATLG